MVHVRNEKPPLSVSPNHSPRRRMDKHSVLRRLENPRNRGTGGRALRTQSTAHSVQALEGTRGRVGLYPGGSWPQTHCLSWQASQSHMSTRHTDMCTKALWEGNIISGISMCFEGRCHAPPPLRTAGSYEGYLTCLSLDFLLCKSAFTSLPESEGPPWFHETFKFLPCLPLNSLIISWLF